MTSTGWSSYERNANCATKDFNNDKVDAGGMARVSASLFFELTLGGRKPRWINCAAQDKAASKPAKIQTAGVDQNCAEAPQGNESTWQVRSLWEKCRSLLTPEDFSFPRGGGSGFGQNVVRSAAGRAAQEVLNGVNRRAGR
ncbi:hypothetical protein KCP78_10950 [Salmonella enterica subsp. enterica]|nr:hypothetical protein KCP78_10950 [Salmonella enterica subsp. enterica]